MGLTGSSTGAGTIRTHQRGKKTAPTCRIALAGNPNVGKSTVFNALTGLRQHTGNWPGKTVSLAEGTCLVDGEACTLIDLPGTYSLLSHSPEEEVARDAICRGDVDVVIVVCDAACLERNLNLVLQIMEICPHVMICVNLLDEAERKGIHIDLKTLSENLGIPAVGVIARKRATLSPLLPAALRCAKEEPHPPAGIQYPAGLLSATQDLQSYLRSQLSLSEGMARWLSIHLIEGHENEFETYMDSIKIHNSEPEARLRELTLQARSSLPSHAQKPMPISQQIAEAFMRRAEDTAAKAVTKSADTRADRDKVIDRVLTSRLTGYPVMILMLALILWITIKGANYPSALLSETLFALEGELTGFLTRIGTAPWLRDALMQGVYRVLAWVVSVMLPPMAIFFPLFTLLEDAGILPRIAFNLDKPFYRCRACGKQALTMAMGFGCNAAGIIGCRIIDSPRERLLAIITNSFVPCNGRFPILISMITLFFVSSGSLLTAGVLTVVILLGIGVTFAVTRLLSDTVLRGETSSYTLELPSYRWPQAGQILVRSLLDRTLFVLGRAAAVAAPAGLLLWILGNIQPGGISLLQRLSGLLDPVGRLMGMDGAILLAFVLGFPANETVIPIMLMIYLSQTSLTGAVTPAEIHAVLLEHGWTWSTAGCVMLFTMMHWPCSTTLLTAYRETKSIKWTALTLILPTICGISACMLLHGVTFLMGV